MIQTVFQQLIQPKSHFEDDRRHEFILNVLLVGAIFLLGTSTVITTIKRLFIQVNPEDVLPLGSIYFILLILIGLLVLSKKGYVTFVSYALLVVYFLLATSMTVTFGIEVQASLLFFVLVIVLSGVLISARVAFVLALLSTLVLALTYFLQIKEVIHPITEWKLDAWGWSEVIVVSAIFFVIALVSWLSNREIERSLRRARKSESDLKAERDMLEIRVEQRTAALQQMQMEKMAQVYKFAEFGRLSSGMFHDLINPLTAISLNIEKMKQDSHQNGSIDSIKDDLERTMGVTTRMQQFITSIKKQISHETTPELFSISQEISEVLTLLDHRAKKAQVQLQFESVSEIQTFGSPMKFNQVIVNIICNAIDSYMDSSLNWPEKTVLISLMNTDNTITITIRDHGVGIPPELKDKIFTPFFSTKTTTEHTDSGTGIGLSLSKRIIERNFSGTLIATPNTNGGSIFTITFPLNFPAV